VQVLHIEHAEVKHVAVRNNFIHSKSISFFLICKKVQNNYIDRNYLCQQKYECHPTNEKLKSNTTLICISIQF